MRALVTGASGFVGSHLVDLLQQQGVQVTAIARSPAKAALLARQGVRVVSADLDHVEGLAQAAKDQEVVFHVAGLVAARNEAEFFRANRDGTSNLLQSSESVGKPRFVLVSSLAAGGPSAHGRPLKGDEPARPVTAYGRSKLAAEKVVRGSALPWSIVRPPMVYGPRDREVLKLFRIARWGVAPVFGDGSQELSAAHAADLAKALVAVATSNRTIHRLYNACHLEIFTSGDLGRAVGQAMGRQVRTVPVPRPLGRAILSVVETSARLAGQTTILTTDKAHEFFQPAWTGDPAPLSRDTGWQASYDLRSGLRETYAWYRQAGWL